MQFRYSLRRSVISSKRIIMGNTSTRLFINNLDITVNYVQLRKFNGRETTRIDASSLREQKASNSQARNNNDTSFFFFFLFFLFSPPLFDGFARNNFQNTLRVLRILLLSVARGGIVIDFSPHFIEFLPPIFQQNGRKDRIDLRNSFRLSKTRTKQIRFKNDSRYIYNSTQAYLYFHS